MLQAQRSTFLQIFEDFGKFQKISNPEGHKNLMNIMQGVGKLFCQNKMLLETLDVCLKCNQNCCRPIPLQQQFCVNNLNNNSSAQAFDLAREALKTPSVTLKFQNQTASESTSFVLSTNPAIPNTFQPIQQTLPSTSSGLPSTCESDCVFPTKPDSLDNNISSASSSKSCPKAPSHLEFGNFGAMERFKIEGEVVTPISPPTHSKSDDFGNYSSSKSADVEKDRRSVYKYVCSNTGELRQIVILV